MKRILSVTGIAFLLFFLILYPKEALSASRGGMDLWLNTLLPTLLPFLILTGFLIHKNTVEKILSPFSCVWNLLLGLSPSGAYAFFLGLLCGYPMGARLASDLYVHGKIGKREAEYLTTFSNQPSPAFLTTYLAHSCLGGSVSPAEILGISFLSCIVCMMFFRFLFFRGKTTDAPVPCTDKKETSSSSQGTIPDISIMNGFETMARLGGYILLFSLLSACICHFWRWNPLIRDLAAAGLEITTGLHQLSQSHLPMNFLYPVSIALTASGGCCILAQTKSVIDPRLSILPYICAKILNSAAAALIVLFFSHIL